MIRTLLEKIATEMLPQSYCLWCKGRSSSTICSSCAIILPSINTKPHCPVCAIPVEHPGDICGECLSEPPPFSKSVCGFYFRNPVDQWVSAYKRSGRAIHRKVLYSELLDEIRSEYQPQQLPQTLVPVPQHWLKTVRRGFNPVEHLSCYLSSTLGVCRIDAIQRSRYGPELRGLDRTQRQQALRGVFKLKAKADLSEMHVALIDDVMTTSTTARTLGKLLISAGARRVDIWCLVRTERANNV